MPTKRIFKPKDGSIELIPVLSEEEKLSREQAIKKSPDLKKLSEPFVTDNGRTLIYFKKGADVQAKGEEFVKHLNSRVL